MQRKWLVASLLILGELAVLGGMMVPSRNGLNWESVFGRRPGQFVGISPQSDDNQSYRETLALAQKGLVCPERGHCGNGKDTLRLGIGITAVGLYPIGLCPACNFPAAWDRG
jgi:hypothetical protein